MYVEAKARMCGVRSVCGENQPFGAEVKVVREAGVERKVCQWSRIARSLWLTAGWRKAAKPAVVATADGVSLNSFRLGMGILLGQQRAALMGVPIKSEPFQEGASVKIWSSTDSSSSIVRIAHLPDGSDL